MRKLYTKILLIGIILLGAVLRVVFFNMAPPALNIDEAALGYNAYSILKTGKDEHGVFLPLSLESFGDWKLPVYSYVAIIPISVFGLTEFSARLPSITAGVVGILLIYLISQKLFNKERASLFAAFFFAVSPWSIFFSRAAYEVNLATTIFLAGFLCFQHAVVGKKKTVIFLIAGTLFGITLLTYHSYIVFTPLFLASLLFVYGRNIKRSQFFYILIPFVFLFLVSLFSVFAQSSEKVSTTSIFTNKDILYGRVENFSKDTINEFQVFDIIHTKYLGLPYHFLQNYLLSFSPKFLFDQGGEKLVHNVDGFGNLYLIDAFLIITGLLSLFYYREKSRVVLVIWIVFAPIASSMTIDSPNSTRLFILMPVFVLISGYGAHIILEGFIRSFLGKVAIIILFACYIVSILFFLNLYFLHNQFHRAQFWKYGMQQVVQLSLDNPEKKIVMRGPENFPYVYFLFYSSYDPLLFQNSAVYYPTTNEGFKLVKEFGKYKFVPRLQDEEEKEGAIYIDDQNFNQGDKTISLPNGDSVYKYFEKTNE